MQLTENDPLLLKELTEKFLEACPELQLGEMFTAPLHRIDHGKIVADMSEDGSEEKYFIAPARSIKLKYPLTDEFGNGARELVMRENLSHPDNPTKYFHPYMAYMPTKFQYKTLKLGDKVPMMAPDFQIIETEITQQHLDQFSAVVFRFALSS